MGRATEGISMASAKFHFKNKNKISEAIVAKGQHALNWICRHKGECFISRFRSTSLIRGSRGISDGEKWHELGQRDEGICDNDRTGKPWPGRLLSPTLIGIQCPH